MDVSRAVDFAVRPLEHADASAVLELFAQADVRMERRDLAAFCRAARTNSSGRVACVGHRIIGCLLLKIISQNRDYFFTSVELVVVDQSFREQGVGRRLLGPFVQQALEGQGQLRAVVAEDNVVAQLFLRDLYGRGAGAICRPVFRCVDTHRPRREGSIKYVFVVPDRTPLQRDLTNERDG